MTRIENAAHVTRLLPPTSPRPHQSRRPRRDVGRRPFVPCELCQGRGTLPPTTEGADEQVCDDCGGSGRAR
jgi:hypothetical protein